MLNAQEATQIAQEIGRDLVDNGRHPASAAAYARSYTYYRDCVAALGYPEFCRVLTLAASQHHSEVR